MNLRFPLYVKILLWFFLNLILLAVIFCAFFEMQFRVGLDSLLLGEAGNRIQAIGDVIGSDLNSRPHSQWDDVLKRFSDGYKVQFYLFHADGNQAAGPVVALPPEVRAKFAMRPNPRRFRGGEGPRSQRPGDAFEGGPPPEFGDERPLPPRHAGSPPIREGEPPKFFVHTTNPNHYWAGVLLPIAEHDIAPRPFLLLAVSDSLSGGGLFVNFWPWVFAGLVAILVSVLFWIPLARGLTRSITQITRATEEIAAGRFETRVDERRRDELGRLGLAINQMAARLAGFVTGQKRFLGDIAHELCSPIARIQLSLGILEQRADDAQRAKLDDLNDEVQQMSSLVNELLSFSKASLQPASIKLRAVMVRSVVDQAVAREGDEDSNLQVEVEDELCALADPDLLMRSVCNLLRNALRYAGQAGPITLTASREGDHVCLKISDCGPGVPSESLAMLFDPFYRPESSRDRKTGGVGLGLAIVKTCVESCQGTVSCRNREPSGFEVTIRLKSST